VVELEQQGLKRPEIAEMAGCGDSTLRRMANGTGTSRYSHQLLTRVAEGLSLPVDRVIRAFYPPTPSKPKPPTDAELAVQQIMDQAAPYLEKINAIPELQKDVAAIKDGMKGMGDAIHEMNDRLASIVVDTTRGYHAEQPGHTGMSTLSLASPFPRSHINGVRRHPLNTRALKPGAEVAIRAARESPAGIRDASARSEPQLHRWLLGVPGILPLRR
jgi:transcriptional regulator with XRE-family HTH domain